MVPQILFENIGLGVHFCASVTEMPGFWGIHKAHCKKEGLCGVKDEEGKVQNSVSPRENATIGFLGKQEFAKVKALG